QYAYLIYQRGDRLAGDAQHVEFASYVDVLQDGQHLCWKETDLHFRQPEAGLAAGDSHVAHGQQAHAARHASAVDARDERYGTGLRLAKDIGEGGAGFRIIELERGTGLQVGARAKGGVARAGDHQRPDVAIGIGLVDGVEQALYDVLIDGVASLGPVDGGPHDVVAGVDNEFVVHDAVSFFMMADRIVLDRRQQVK